MKCENIVKKKQKQIDFDFHFTGITSGRGYAHGEVGIAYVDIESVSIKMTKHICIG